MKHTLGSLESMKFNDRRDVYYDYQKFLKKKDISLEDFMEHFTAYVGHMSLNRVFTLYELYKKTLGVAGHIAEIGVYKGAGTILFAKLVQIFESEALTQVHGFDWFKGTGEIGENDSELVPEGGYAGDPTFLNDIIVKQKLDHIIRIHNFDLTKKLNEFFEEHPHLQFKLVFLDAGFYEVMKACVPAFWDRLVPGGIMVLDQYSHELAPGETKSIRELLPNQKVKTIPNSWMPNAFIIKD